MYLKWNVTVMSSKTIYLEVSQNKMVENLSINTSHMTFIWPYLTHQHFIHYDSQRPIITEMSISCLHKYFRCYIVWSTNCRESLNKKYSLITRDLPIYIYTHYNIKRNSNISLHDSTRTRAIQWYNIVTWVNSKTQKT